VELRKIQPAVPRAAEEGGVKMNPVSPPRYYRIDDRMLDPRFFHRTVDGVITDDGKFEGHTVTDPPPVGTMVRFKLHKFDGDRFASGAIVAVAELDAYEKWEKRRWEIVAEERAWQDLVERATKENAARDFNASLNIPVRWQTAQKIALNACYEGNGSGARSNSVEHIQIMETLVVGRLKRAAKDLLCGAKPGYEGLSTTGPHWFSKPDDPIYRVTCTACLKIAKRLVTRSRADCS
jgi:hypothetical protein